MMFHLYYTVFNSESIQRNLSTSNIMVTVNMFIVDALILRIVSHPLICKYASLEMYMCMLFLNPTTEVSLNKSKENSKSTLLKMNGFTVC